MLYPVWEIELCCFPTTGDFPRTFSASTSARPRNPSDPGAVFFPFSLLIAAANSSVVIGGWGGPFRNAVFGSLSSWASGNSVMSTISKNIDSNGAVTGAILSRSLLSTNR